MRFPDRDPSLHLSCPSSLGVGGDLGNVCFPGRGRQKRSPDVNFASPQLWWKHYPAGRLCEGDLLERPCEAVKSSSFNPFWQLNYFLKSRIAKTWERDKGQTRRFRNLSVGGRGGGRCRSFTETLTGSGAKKDRGGF